MLQGRDGPLPGSAAGQGGDAEGDSQRDASNQVR
jgi:hypothetical protein